MKDQTWFTADMHFGHANIIRLCNRPFSDVNEMNEMLVANFNALVRPNDKVFFLGDIAFKDRADKYLPRLNGYKVLIEGNHDVKYNQSLFDEICQIREENINTRGRAYRFVMCHYPMLEWPGYYKGAIHLHGHQHNKPEYNERMRSEKLLRYDVGVDANNFFPVSAEQIISFFEAENLL
jgi:calcineurin-like phosphoesterase family protein